MMRRLVSLTTTNYKNSSEVYKKNEKLTLSTDEESFNDIVHTSCDVGFSQSQEAFELTVRDSVQLTPEKVGFCVSDQNRSLNEALFVNEANNMQFTPNLSEVSQGKFQFAATLCRGEDVLNLLPGIELSFVSSKQERILSKGTILLGKKVYFLDQGIRRYDRVGDLNSSDFVQATLMETSVVRFPNEHTCHLRKKINGSYFMSSSNIDFEFSQSIYKHGQWTGAYSELQVDSHVGDQINKSLGFSSSPSHLVISDLNNPSQQIKGGKNILIFHESGSKFLVTEYTLVAIDVDNPVVSFGLRAAKDWILEKMKVEAGRSIDGMRKLSHL